MAYIVRCTAVCFASESNLCCVGVAGVHSLLDFIVGCIFQWGLTGLRVTQTRAACGEQTCTERTGHYKRLEREMK
jgi:hypothetical protein